MNLDVFADKIGKSKCFIVKQLEEIKEGHSVIPVKEGIKDANDVLRWKPNLIWKYLENASAMPEKHIIQFSSIRNDVKEKLLNPKKF